jgi:hypothetical protein
MIWYRSDGSKIKKTYTPKKWKLKKNCCANASHPDIREPSKAVT